MTTEQAIKLLHRLQDEQFDGIHGDERREALSMAVRALEGDGDMISRQAAIDAVVSAMIDGADAELVEGVMELLPSAQPERPEQPESAKEYCAECNHIEMCRWYPYEGCEFRSLPSAQPRKKGKWIKLDMHAHIADHKCTACGQECYVPTCMGEPMYTYCPNCGCRMGGDESEDT